MANQTLFLRDFTILDYAFLDAQKGIQGDSLYVSVELEGELDHQGFIFDFGPAKKLLKAMVDDCLDHKLLVPTNSHLVGLADGFRFGEILYEAPSEAVVVVEEEQITPAVLEKLMASLALEILPKNITGVRFFLREENFSGRANFRYSHGLRLHQGNCQRLLHGHRNPIEVWVKGERAPDWELFLAREWENVHFALDLTVKNRDALDLPLGERRQNLKEFAELSYQSPQGAFRAKLPAANLVLLPAEPSIENIARLGAERIRQKGETGEILVRAYEGLNKGASFTLR